MEGRCVVIQVTEVLCVLTKEVLRNYFLRWLRMTSSIYFPWNKFFYFKNDNIHSFFKQIVSKRAKKGFQISNLKEEQLLGRVEQTCRPSDDHSPSNRLLGMLASSSEPWHLAQDLRAAPILRQFFETLPKPFILKYQGAQPVWRRWEGPASCPACHRRRSGWPKNPSDAWRSRLHSCKTWSRPRTWHREKAYYPPPCIIWLV